MEGWTTDRVLALAPDAAAARAAQGLAQPGPWSATGRTARAVWGDCRGSGRTPYAVRANLDGPAWQCSCPSRKQPCKHVLGLLLLATEQPGAVPEAPAPPDDVAAWLGGREARAGGGRPAADAPAKAPDPEAQAARRERRAQRTADGMAELRRWLADVARRGLGAVQAEPYAFWDRVAARMVDAQAPGAASRIRRLAGIAAGAGPDWAERLLEELALLHLLVEAHDRLDVLPPGVQADVRSQLGWPVAQEDVLAGPRTRGRWTVLARVVEEQDRLTVGRTWLHGPDGRPALLLAFAPPGAPLDAPLAPGTVVDAELAFYPSAAPLRALVAAVHGEQAAPAAPAGAATADAALAARAAALAASPWADRWPVALRAAVPVEQDGGWALRTDADAVGLATDDETAWTLLALSGGRPIGVYGEWTGTRVRPFAAHADGETVALR
jgi:hypothetical protein